MQFFQQLHSLPSSRFLHQHQKPVKQHINHQKQEPILIILHSFCRHFVVIAFICYFTMLLCLFYISILYKDVFYKYCFIR